MPILSDNIQFRASQVMDDVPEGGGRATATVIVDGASNEIFPDISEADRAGGRVRMRKLFLSVDTPDTDQLLGANVIVAKPPADPNVSVALLSTGDYFDRRSDAADRVEAYLFAGPEWSGYLLENHIAGQRSIQIFQRVGSGLPPVGRTLCLVQDEGLPAEKRQYVRVISVAAVERTFSYSTGGNIVDYQALVVTADLSDALREDLLGSPPNRLFTREAAGTRIRDTTVADAARYYGAARLAAPGAIGTLSARLDSMFTQLVPSAQTETPLANQLLAPELVTTLSAGTRTVDVAQQAHTRALPVTAENRRFNWIETLLPIPAPGALTLAYMAQGNWYVLADDGAGVLSGADPSAGAGTISYTTGNLAATLGALPDAGSQILMTWASPVHYAVRAGATSAAAGALRFEYTLANAPIVPGTHVASYPVGGVTRTTTDAAGVISGTGVSGTINYATGAVALDFTAPPDRAALLTNAYTWRDGADVVSNSGTDGIPVVGGQIDLSAFAPFRGAGKLRFNLADGSQAEGYLGTGGTVFVASGHTQAGQHFGSQNVGVYSASTGIVTITNPVTWTKRTWNPGERRWDTATGTVPVVSAWDVRIEKDTDAYNPNAVTGETVPVSEAGLTLELDLTTTVADAIVPNSLRFTVAGKTYDDRNGTLYTDIDPVTGSGINAGSLDYATGVATLTYWADGVAAGLSVTSCLTRYGDWTATESCFRTPVSPLKPESVSLVAVTTDGVQITGVADPDGVITGTWMRGAVNYEFGTASVEFGQMAGDPPAWTPREVDPATIRYNAVAYSYLPLDATLLGLDPVRLPSDGRVPIFRPGEFAVFGHDVPLASQTVTASQTVALGVERLSRVRISDAAGLGIGSGWTADLDAGTVTIDDPTGWQQPVTITGRIEDMVRVSDVQISGDITFTRPLTHAFPAGATVSSALMLGDQRARVSHFFDQATWDNSWSDSIVGAAATASYDDAQYPPEVTNEGAITERWIVRFQNTTTIEVIGEHVGIIYTGPTSSDIAPNNPAAGAPYFTLRALGFGLGWSAGNIIRLNTVGAQPPIWAVLTVQQGATTVIDDAWELLARGDVDRP